MKITANTLEDGQLARRTRGERRGVYYTIASGGKTVDTRRKHHLRRLSRKVSLVGREAWLLGKLSEGWVPLHRWRRFVDSLGKKHETKELTAAPVDYEFRVVANKPGFS